MGDRQKGKDIKKVVLLCVHLLCFVIKPLPSLEETPSSVYPTPWTPDPSVGHDTRPLNLKTLPSYSSLLATYLLQLKRPKGRIRDLLKIFSRIV